MAIVATGGYGRGLLAPGSDIDLLFLLPYKQTAWGESGRRGHPLLPVGHRAEGRPCHALDRRVHPPGQGRHDRSARRCWSRVICSATASSTTSWSRASTRRSCRAPAPEFVAAKLAEREERHRRAGQSRYLVEPNVKDGKGGLARPAHAVLDRQIRLSRARARGADRARRVRPAASTAGSAAAAISSGRCAATCTFVTGRAEERLSFDIQREIAVRLGYTEHPGMQDVERFMKHYFLIAKDVGDLTAILCAKLEDKQAKPVPVLSRMMAKFRPRPRRTLTETEDFIVDNNRINVADENVFQRDPVNLIRIFHLAQKHNLAFHPDAMRIATRSLKLIDQTAARERGGQPAVPRNPDLEERRRDRAAADERGRRARPLRARLRPDRRDDAVQHVSPLHGGRASAALHRRAFRHRCRPHRGHQVRQRADAHDPAAASRAALCRAVPARHRQGPDRGSFDRRRARGAAASARGSASRRRRPKPSPG